MRKQLQSMYEQDQQLRFTEKPKKKTDRFIKSTRHIPIYIFSINYDTPVLVDKYYQAKALQDMVIAVQTNFFKHRTRIQCNDNTVNWNLRNPLRQILSCCALTLGGVIPPHISYSRGRQRATQQWLWSIGDNPFSHTSHSYRFSNLHKDIIYRNYVTIALEESIQTVNSGLSYISQYRTTHINWESHKLVPKEELKKTIKTLRSLWKKAVTHISFMNWEEAIDVVKEIQKEVAKYKVLILDSTTILDIFRCPSQDDRKNMNSLSSSNRYQKGIHWLYPTLIFSNIITFFAYIIFRQRKHKMKIN